MNFSEFQSCTMKEASPFQRKQFDFATNLVKWIAMRFAYIFYKLGLTANMLDILTLFLTLFGAILVVGFKSDDVFTSLVGVSLLAFGVFVDFIDGPIAKARNECSDLGDALDNIGVDFVRAALLIVFGVLSAENYIIIVNLFSLVILFSLIPSSIGIIEDSQVWKDSVLLNMIFNLYTNRYSFLGVRVMIPVMLGVLIFGIIGVYDIQVLSVGVSLVYAAASIFWLMLLLLPSSP